MKVSPASICVSLTALLISASTVNGQTGVSPWTRSQGWGPWSEWSACSSTCDPELSVRVRTCQTSNGGRIPSNTQGYKVDHLKKTCNGTGRQYRVCEKKTCAGKRTDYRQRECDKENSVPFRGKQYRWQAYINSYDKCTVACKATNYGFYKSFARPVRDGEPCDERTDHVCLKGKCQNIGCDGVVGSTTRKDYCGVCGGDNTSCRIISGIYTRTHLKYGYNTITTIPAGACSVNITEMARSRNYLVLKYKNGTAIINGDRRLSRPGNYPASGTTVKYDKFRGSHCPGECINAEGPLSQPLELQVLSYRRNPGIKYMYTIPVDMIDQVMQTFVGPSSSRRQSPNQNRHGNHNHNSNHQTRNQVNTNRSNGSHHSRVRFGERPQYVPPDTSDSYQQFQTSDSHRGTQDAINRYRQRYGQGTSTNQIEGEQTETPVQQTGSRFYNREYPQTGNYGTRAKYQSRDWTGYQKVDTSIPGNTPKQEPSLQISNTVDRINFYWSISGFTECSQTCGGGNQETNVVCMKRVANVIVTEENCDPAEKPKIQTVTCNATPCPPGWESADWSECSQSCGTGMQTRRVECKQTISAEVTVPVSANSCDLGARPVSSRSCQVQPCFKWTVGNWTECSVDCGVGRKSRSVVCTDATDRQVRDGQCEQIKPETGQSCDMGVCAQGWFHTEWSDECSTSCGEGYHTRDVYCSAEDGTPLDEKKCGDKPRTAKRCRKSRPCGGNWFTGPWQQCTATCGTGTRTRDVVCMKKLGSELFTIVDEENCEGKKRPSTQEPCPALEPCPSQWFMTEWSQCSKSCDTGTKTRKLKCLDMFLNPSSACSPDEKPSSRHSCNIHSCDRPQLDSDPGCSDKWTRCRLVVQARLCSYKYYRDQCCSSCKLHHIHHQNRKRHRQRH